MVYVFDIATETWFSEFTIAEGEIYPANRVGFCSVVASADSNSSHNIYIYGGLDKKAEVCVGKSEVFILILPAFHWVLVYPFGDESRDNNFEGRKFRG